MDLESEELYYPCSENKGADQLRSYCEADLRLCFRLCRLLVFPCGGSYFSAMITILEPSQLAAGEWVNLMFANANYESSNEEKVQRYTIGNS